jgi:hypothetical protein
MPEMLWNLEWLNANAQRRYPVTIDSSSADDTDTFELPSDFLVGLDIPINSGLNVDPSRFFIRQIGAYATGYSVVVGYQPTSGDAVIVGTALIGRATHNAAGRT